MSEEVEILRADGAKSTSPGGGYFHPSELWFAYRDPAVGRSFSSRWWLSYVALADGRFCVRGDLWCIRHDDYEGILGRGGRPHRRNNFASRTAAIRAAAARQILIMRAARRWIGHWDSLERGHDFARAVNWVLHLVDRETDGRRTRRRLVVGPPGLVDTLIKIGHSRKWIRSYIESSFPQPKPAPDGPR